MKLYFLIRMFSLLASNSLASTNMIVCNSVDHLDIDHIQGTFTVSWELNSSSPSRLNIKNVTKSPSTGLDFIQTLNDDSTTCGVDNASIFGKQVSCPFGGMYAGNRPDLLGQACYTDKKAGNGTSYYIGIGSNLDLQNSDKSFSCVVTEPSGVSFNLWLELSNCH
jgi:hypothetical protein